VRLMRHTRIHAAVMMALSTVALAAHAAHSPVQLGPRPFYLVDQLAEGELKNKLAACLALIENYRPHDFSIGHRDAALQFPEHTKESYEAGRRVGAGILGGDLLLSDHARCAHQRWRYPAHH
jgi:glycerophosphoryl diester phosphodiesterase